MRNVIITLEECVEIRGHSIKGVRIKGQVHVRDRSSQNLTKIKGQN